MEYPCAEQQSWQVVFSLIVTEALILKTAAGQSMHTEIIYQKIQLDSCGRTTVTATNLFQLLSTPCGPWSTVQALVPPARENTDTESVSLNEQDKQLTFGKPHTLEYTFEEYIYEVCGFGN